MGATRDKVSLDADFTELYRAHLRDVYSYAYYRIGNHHDAEDITEQTFLQAYRHFERAQRESGGRPLRPWLIRIAHNLAANYYRDRSRKPQTQLEDAAVISAPHVLGEQGPQCTQGGSGVLDRGARSGQHPHYGSQQFGVVSHRRSPACSLLPTPPAIPAPTALSLCGSTPWWRLRSAPAPERSRDCPCRGRTA